MNGWITGCSPPHDSKKEVTDGGSLTEDIVEHPPPSPATLHAQTSSPEPVCVILCFCVVNMTWLAIETENRPLSYNNCSRNIVAWKRNYAVVLDSDQRSNVIPRSWDLWMLLNTNDVVIQVWSQCLKKFLCRCFWSKRCGSVLNVVDYHHDLGSYKYNHAGFKVLVWRSPAFGLGVGFGPEANKSKMSSCQYIATIRFCS